MREQALAITFDGRSVEVAFDVAERMADHLWKGLQPGAVTCAAKLSNALARTAHEERTVLQVDQSEVVALRDALAAVGLSSAETR